MFLSICTVITRKQWNKKKLPQYLTVVDVVLLDTNFFRYSIAQKNPQNFCSLKIISSEKQKFVNIYCFYQILKFYKNWITESQQIRKIVIRKFAIFSVGLIFKEKLFFNGSSVFNWTAYIYNFRLKYAKKKRTIEYLKITLFKIFKLNLLEFINSPLTN